MARRALLPLLALPLAEALLTSQARNLSSAELQCRAKCGCRTNFAFVASTAAAHDLYVGCKATAIDARLPHFLSIGAQKAGTTSLYNSITRGNGRFCGTSHGTFPGEAHYFDNPKFLMSGPSATALRENYLTNWRHCRPDQAWMEKTPGYLWAPGAALRVCESLGQPRLLAQLREPVSRAYSAFWRNHGDAIWTTPQGFHQLASADVAIAKKCGGMPTGNPRLDLARKGRFRRCCDGVARRFNLTDWPGCSCKVPQRSPFLCTPYGRKDFALVRTGIYAPQLRNWFRYHRAENLLVMFAEDFFQDMPGALSELHCKLGPQGFKSSCHGKPDLDFQEVHSNSWVKKHDDMLPETRKMLQDFYRPHNEELFALLGRRAAWE